MPQQRSSAVVFTILLVSSVLAGGLTQPASAQSGNVTIDDVLTDETSQFDVTVTSLDGNESATVELSWETQDGDAGEYTAAVESETERGERG